MPSFLLAQLTDAAEQKKVSPVSRAPLHMVRKPSLHSAGHALCAAVRWYPYKGWPPFST